MLKIKHDSLTIASDAAVQFNSAIGKKCLFSTKISFSNSSCADNVVIGAQSTVLNSSLAHFVTIFNNCLVSDSVISEYVKIRIYCELANVKVGAYSYVNQRSKLTNCDIGKFCSIAADVKIGLGIHPVDFASTHPAFYSPQGACAITFAQKKFFNEHKRVSIGNDVWIGANVLIMDGVKVGNGAIVAAGSIVNKDVGEYEIVAGVPAKLIKKRFDEETITNLQKSEWWNKDIKYFEKNLHLFQSPLTAEVAKQIAEL